MARFIGSSEFSIRGRETSELDVDEKRVFMSMILGARHASGRSESRVVLPRILAKGEEESLLDHLRRHHGKLFRRVSLGRDENSTGDSRSIIYVRSKGGK